MVCESRKKKKKEEERNKRRRRGKGRTGRVPYPKVSDYVCEGLLKAIERDESHHFHGEVLLHLSRATKADGQQVQRFGGAFGFVNVFAVGQAKAKETG